MRLWSEVGGASCEPFRMNMREKTPMPRKRKDALLT